MPDLGHGNEAASKNVDSADLTDENFAQNEFALSSVGGHNRVPTIIFFDPEARS
jgi:hypothetical protein